MKYIIILIALLGFSFGVSNAQKNTIITEEITVSGNCNMCKKTIENAANIKGVKRAEWDKNTKILKVTYSKTHTSKEKIAQSIADAGYDADTFKASQKAYEALSPCCEYRQNNSQTH